MSGNKLSVNSAQLREELTKYQDTMLKDKQHIVRLEKRIGELSPQSLLIEKLSYALANVMLTIEALNMSVKNELHPDLKKAIADNVSIGREVLALLPQDEKREGK